MGTTLSCIFNFISGTIKGTVPNNGAISINTPNTMDITLNDTLPPGSILFSHQLNAIGLGSITVTACGYPAIILQNLGHIEAYAFFCMNARNSVAHITFRDSAQYCDILFDQQGTPEKISCQKGIGYSNNDQGSITFICNQKLPGEIACPWISANRTKSNTQPINMFNFS